MLVMVHINMTTSLHQQLLQESHTNAGQKGQPFTCPAAASTCVKLPPLPMNRPLMSKKITHSKIGLLFLCNKRVNKNGLFLLLKF